jgi:AraC-like DNA-binding protein
LQRKLTERGVGLRDLVRDARTFRARDMLSIRGLPIAVIAAELGYENRGSFDQAFRRATGSSPGAYRASVTAPAAPGGA